MKKKIVLLTDTIAPYRIPVFNIISKESIFDFNVISLTENMIGRDWRIDKRKMEFKHNSLDSRQFRLPLSNRLPLVIDAGLISTLDQLRPDLIIITGYYQPAFLRTLLYAKKNGIKIVCWIESNSGSVRMNDFFSFRYRAWFINMCDAFIVPGIRSKEFLESQGINESRIFMAPNSCDSDLYSVDLDVKYSNRHKTAKWINYPEKNLLYTGRLIKEKGIEILLRAYKAADLGSDVGLILVGTGRGESYFKTLSKKLGLRNVFFEGFKQPEELKDYYAVADLYVCPSQRDEWGMVINEAATAGLPIISSHEPGASGEVVSEKNGWLFNKNDITELQSCLRNVLLSAEELMKKSVESQRIAARYSPKKCAEGVLKCVTDTLEKKQIVVSSSGVLYSHGISKALFENGLLQKIFTPHMPQNKDKIPRHYVGLMVYPRLLFGPIVKIARKYGNISNIFVDRENILFDKRVSTCLRKIEFDVFCGFSGSALYSMLEAKRQGKVCIVDQHDIYYKAAAKVFEKEICLNPKTGLSGISYWPLHKGYCERVDQELKIADYIFVPSSYSLRTYLEHGIPESRLVLMPVGVSSRLIKKTVMPPKANEFTVGFVGSIGLRKGIGYLLDAVKEIDNPAIKLNIAGSFSAKNSILRRYKGCYKYFGFLEHDKIPAFLSGLDVLVLPSLVDAFGIVILEAMASGVPVIATENSAGPDIIEDGKQGFVVPIRNAQAIKEKILFLYNNRDLAKEMGYRALEKVSEYTWDRYRVRLQNFIEKIYLRQEHKPKKTGVPLVSVIIITHNMAEYLPQAIESVLQQTFKDYELIVIDDGSVDDTEDAISAYKDKLTYRYFKNAGRGTARNRGLKLARGKYVAFLDADDIWSKDKLMQQIEYAQNNELIDVIYSPATFVDSQAKRELHKLSRDMSKFYRRDINTGLSYEKMIFGSGIYMSSTLIKRDIFNEVGDFNEWFRAREDVDWYFRVLSRDRTIKLNGLKPLVRLRAHNRKTSMENIDFEYLKIFNREIERSRSDKRHKWASCVLARLYLACVPFYKRINHLDNAWVYLIRAIRHDRRTIVSPLSLRYLASLCYLSGKRFLVRTKKSI